MSAIDVVMMALMHTQAALEPRPGRADGANDAVAREWCGKAMGALEKLRALEQERDEARKHANIAGEMLADAHREIELLRYVAGNDGNTKLRNLGVTEAPTKEKTS